MALLTVERAGKEYSVEGGVLRRRVGTVRALHDASFELQEGESLGLVGESGSGKTTLGRIIARLLPPTTGRVLWEGEDQNSFSRREWASRVQMIFQDPTSSLNPKLTVRSLLREPLRARAGGTGSIDERVRELLRTVGLADDALDHYPHQFSGGQKQRLAIGRALAMGPRLLVADEPVSALDLSIQAQILNLLMDLKDRFQLSLIVVSHDLAVVSHLADRVIVLKEGEIVEQGETASVLANPRHPYTQTLLEAVPTLLR